MNNIKSFIFFNQIKEIIEIFGQIEVGCSEVDVKALAEYLLSDNFIFNSLEYNSDEEAQQWITNYILDGFPVWRFLKCSDWTKKMLEKSFTEECDTEYNKLIKKYCCFSCKYFVQTETSIGIHTKCINNDRKNKSMWGKRNEFNLKTKCKYYEKI